jgi:hypothetical protein
MSTADDDQERVDGVLDVLKAHNVSALDVGAAMSAVLDRLVNCEHDGHKDYCEDCGARDFGAGWVVPRLLESLSDDMAAAMERAIKRGTAAS